MKIINLPAIRKRCQDKFDAISNALKTEFTNVNFDFSSLDARLAGGLGIRSEFVVIKPSEYTADEYRELLDKVVLFIKQNFKKTYPYANKGWGLGSISVSANNVLSADDFLEVKED